MEDLDLFAEDVVQNARILKETRDKIIGVASVDSYAGRILEVLNTGSAEAAKLLREFDIDEYDAPAAIVALFSISSVLSDRAQNFKVAGDTKGYDLLMFASGLSINVIVDLANRVGM